MTISNKQLGAVRAARAACKGLAAYVGEYPHNCESVGDQSAILIQAGDEDWTFGMGNTNDIEMLIFVHLYTVKGAAKTKTMLDLQTAVANAMLSDVTLGGEVKCLVLSHVYTGDQIDTGDLITVGYNANLQHRMIEFSVGLSVGGSYG